MFILKSILSSQNEYDDSFKNYNYALAGVAQLTEESSHNRRIEGFDSWSGQRPRLQDQALVLAGTTPSLGLYRKQTSMLPSRIDFSTLPFSLSKINEKKMSLGEDKKKLQLRKTD